MASPQKAHGHFVEGGLPALLDALIRPGLPVVTRETLAAISPPEALQAWQACLVISIPVAAN